MILVETPLRKHKRNPFTLTNISQYQKPCGSLGRLQNPSATAGKEKRARGTMKKKRRHLTPQEIMEQCKAVARESRMAYCTPWSAMSIMCLYVVMKSEGFKGQRIYRLVSKINWLEEQWDEGKVDLKEVANRLYEKADWTIECRLYTEADIRAKKGSYQYWLDKVQINPQNMINEQATRYMLFFYNALMDEFGFGKERLRRVGDYMNQLLLDYQQDKTTVHSWKQALFEEAGVVVEMPIDPLTQTKGSLIT